MNEESQQSEQEFVARVKQVLDRTARDLDPAVSLRLQHARLAALEKPASWSRRLIWISGAAASAGAALALALWLTEPVPEHHAAVPLDDFELVTSVEDVELAEDLDFYHWLADDDSRG